jgi:hypothetical protein
MYDIPTTLATESNRAVPSKGRRILPTHFFPDTKDEALTVADHTAGGRIVVVYHPIRIFHFSPYR